MLLDCNAATLKVFTVTAGATAVVENEPTVSVPLLPTVPPPVGVRLIVTDVVAPPPLIVPRLQMTLLSVGVEAQLPPETDAETNVTGALPLPPDRLSIKATFDVVSPLFVIGS